MIKITTGVYTFTGLIVGRVYAIADPDGLTLIDTSIAPVVPRIERQVKTAGYEMSDIKRILITHGHPDHIGGLADLLERTGAVVYGLDVERDLIVEQVPSAADVYTAFSEGEVIGSVMDGLHVLHTPGHSPGHATFWQPRRRIAFIGDVAMNIMNRLTLPFASVTPDMVEDRRQLTRLAALNPDVICFGHGPVRQGAAAAAFGAFAAGKGL